MKICILTHCFYPSKLRGGPTVSMTNLVKALKGYEEIHVITVNFDKDGSKYSEFYQGCIDFYGAKIHYLNINTISEFWKKIKNIHPDILYINSFFSWEYCVPAFIYGKMYQSRIILAPRGELLPSALKQKYLKKRLYFIILRITGLIKNIEIHSTSDDEEKYVRKLFKKEKIWKINNLPSFSINKSNATIKNVGNLKIIMLGRIHPIKNIDYAIKIMSSVIGNVQLDIYGNSEIKEYEAYCEQLSKNLLHDNITVHFCGIISHEQIENVFVNYHILLSPTQSENFGQSIVEAMLNAKPVIISDNTPWKQLQESNAGYDISLCENDKFVRAIQEFIDMNQEKYNMYCNNAYKYINDHINYDKIVDLYKEMLFHK